MASAGLRSTTAPWFMPVSFGITAAALAAMNQSIETLQRKS